MAEGQLRFEIDLGHGALKFWKVKQWIVSEAAGASRRGQNDAFDRTVACVLDSAVSSCNEHAVVSSVALVWRQISESLEQYHVVPDVGVVICVGRIDEACIGSKTG